MQVVTNEIGALVLHELAKAAAVDLAVAFFSPERELLPALRKVPKLRLVISEEFTVNDPKHLRMLPKSATIRSIPTFSDEGKLHAKVLIVRRKDASQWVLMGSANMTWCGLFRNQEACIALDTRHAEDGAPAQQFVTWFQELIRTARVPDMVEAQRIFDARSNYRLERRPNAKKAATTANYWALKTTSGFDGMEHWPEFLAGNVLAIGWEKLKVDPSVVTVDVLRDALYAAFPDYNYLKAQKAIASISKFLSLDIGDVVLICKGYAKVQEKGVHIYGLARVTGPFRADRFSGRKWRFKHDAVIQPVGIDLPKDALAEALGKGSLRETIHDLDREAFGRLCELLRESGVQVEV